MRNVLPMGLLPGPFAWLRDWNRRGSQPPQVSSRCSHAQILESAARVSAYPQDMYYWQVKFHQWLLPASQPSHGILAHTRLQLVTSTY